MAVKIPLYLISYHRKIAYLYRRCLREVESRHRLRINYIYEAAALRAQFDNIYNEKDMRKSKQMYLEKEKELSMRLFKPINFPTSPRGVDYERYTQHSDEHLDYWHPLEKAAYPEYFARREIRKQQYLELWEKMHGPPKPDEFKDH